MKTSDPPRRLRFSRSIGAKLFVLLFAALLLVMALLGWAMIRLHRNDLEHASLLSGEQLVDALRRSTSYYMLRNDRAALYHTIETLGGEPGIGRVRILNDEGRISFSSHPAEVGRIHPMKPGRCHDCHDDARTLPHLDGSGWSRIFERDGKRFLGVMTPIENAPSCSSADCHAHPQDQQLLGILDLHLSLAESDAHLAGSTRTMVAYSFAGVLSIALISGLFVFRFVQRPITRLKRTTRRLAAGEYGLQTQVSSPDEIGEMAASLNVMSSRLQHAREEESRWNQALEARVAEKTRELTAAHAQMVQAEKLTSLGKLAAVVAHEINNPLSGILSYAKLIRRWVEREAELDAKRQDMKESLELIESESRRCGELVKGLLAFGRAQPMQVGPVELHPVLSRCVQLVIHKLELNGITLRYEVPDELDPVRGDAPQLEQLFLALMMNAIEAIGRDGHLTVEAWDRGETVEVAIEDDGCGIPPDIVPHIFEPFHTTKEQGGVGLGLAISRTIVERHGGTVVFHSEPGRGTRFTITLPKEESLTLAAPHPSGKAEERPS